MIKLTSDVWLSEIMARPVYRVAVNGAGNDALETPRGFYFARVAAHDVRITNALADLGFRIVDMGVTLERAAMAEEPASVHVRPAVLEDRDRVMAIAREGFKYSRFHLDPAIPVSLANEIKSQWAGNFFKGQRGDQMVVAEADGRVAGFLQIIDAADGAMVIDLIAVDAQARSRGLGRAMIRWAAVRTKQPRLRVGTQAANADSLRFYENLGFRTVSSAYVMHLHA